VELEIKSDLQRAMKGNIQYIYHCAAKGGDWGKAKLFWNANVIGTQNMIELALKLPNLKRFLHVSTVDVYPSQIPTKDCFEEFTKISPFRRAQYSITKTLADLIVIDAHKQHQLPITIVRPAAVFGPYSMSFGYVEAKILRSEHGLLISGGDHACGAIYIDDCVEHMILASRSPNTIGKIYNSSAYQDKTWRMYYNALADGIGSPRPRWSIPYWLAVIIAWWMEFYWSWTKRKERPYLTLFLLGLIARPQLWPIVASERDFNWKPRISFEEAMNRHCTWLRTLDLDDE